MWRPFTLNSWSIRSGKVVPQLDRSPEFFLCKFNQRAISSNDSTAPGSSKDSSSIESHRMPGPPRRFALTVDGPRLSKIHQRSLREIADGQGKKAQQNKIDHGTVGLRAKAGKENGRQGRRKRAPARHGKSIPPNDLGKYEPRCQLNRPRMPSRP